MTTIKTLITAAAVSLLALSNAHAGGILSDVFIKPFSPELAREADRINHNLGNPVDHGIAAGMNVVVPGSGTALEAGWAVNRSGVLNRVGQAHQAQQAQIGNFCLTPAGRFGPGPVNTLGSPCHVLMPYGPVMGTVGR